MYFALGFLAAGLLALVIAPAVWQRAVRLTRKKVENARPVSLSEIAAEKDQLRAEHAIVSRRLESSVSEFREKAAERLIELNRKQQSLNAIRTERDEKSLIITEHEKREAELRQELLLKEEKIAQVSADLRRAQRDLTERVTEYGQVEIVLAKSKEITDEQKVALIAKETEIGSLKEEIAELRGDRQVDENDMSRIRDALRKAEAELVTEQQTVAQFANEIERLRKEVDHRNQLLNTHDEKMTRMREEFASEAGNRLKSDADLVNLEMRCVEAEAEVAHLRSVLESKGDSEADPEALKELKSQLAARDQDLQLTIRERDEAMIRLVELEKHSKSDRGAERAENAVLRERLNDLASDVLRITSALDGERTERPSPNRSAAQSSPTQVRSQQQRPSRNNEKVSEPVEHQPAASLRSIGAKVQLVADNSETFDESSDNEGEQPVSLADRIRALQRQSRS